MTLTPDMLHSIEALVDRFAQIGHERLQGLPVYNNNLHVEAVDFQTCPHGLLGALVTPWFINIMLLPFEKEKCRQDETGKKQAFNLSSGDHEFVLGDDEVVGKYFFRSVISPPHCYQTQVAARQAAQVALQQLLDIEDETAPQVTSSQQVHFEADLPEQQGRREFMRNIFGAGIKGAV